MKNVEDTALKLKGSAEGRIRSPSSIPDIDNSNFQKWFSRFYPSLKWGSLLPSARKRISQRFLGMNNPEIKAKMKAYYQRPEIKAKMKAYHQRPEIKAKTRRYMRNYMRTYSKKLSKKVSSKTAGGKRKCKKK